MKEHVKIVKTYMLMFNVIVLDKLKILGDLTVKGKYMKIMSFLIKMQLDFLLFGKKFFFLPNLNPPSYLNIRKEIWRRSLTELSKKKMNAL